jgi:hypothetical protein
MQFYYNFLSVVMIIFVLIIELSDGRPTELYTENEAASVQNERGERQLLPKGRII